MQHYLIHKMMESDRRRASHQIRSASTQRFVSDCKDGGPAATAAPSKGALGLIFTIQLRISTRIHTLEPKDARFLSTFIYSLVYPSPTKRQLVDKMHILLRSSLKPSARWRYPVHLHVCLSTTQFTLFITSYLFAITYPHFRLSFSHRSFPLVYVYIWLVPSVFVSNPIQDCIPLFLYIFIFAVSPTFDATVRIPLFISISNVPHTFLSLDFTYCT